MANHQNHEWDEAQKIVISTNLITAAKKHLQFLEVIDNNGSLYKGPILEKAIFRYKYYWLPLLAKHTESKLPQSQLVVPLDCEWVWHCHRLNPVRYMADCRKLFGRILDPGCVVLSSIKGACKKYTEEIWNKKYPEEPYELDLNDHFRNDSQIKLATLQSTNYDLLSAVKRQSSFYQQVSKTSISDDLYLVGAVQRYKGFLYLVRRNIEMKLKNAYVPTYDIDLMWHTHQLYPLCYYTDALALVGQVLHHDDTDTDQSKGGKLDVEATTTIKKLEELFGSEYWSDGLMSRGTIKGMNGEKVIARCKCLDEDKLTARCNLTARCMCLNKDKLIARCKLTARCMCLDEDKLTARCMYLDEDKLTARCMCLGEDMLTARCKCLDEAMEGEKLTPRCKSHNEAMEGQKLTVRCKCLDETIEGHKLAQRATEFTREKLAPRSSDWMFVEILVEIMEVTNLPVTHKGNLVLCIAKQPPGIMFGKKRWISICTEPEETQTVVLQCEPKGELLFELFSNSNLDSATKSASPYFGTTSISLADLLKSIPKLTILRRMEFGSGIEPIMLSVALTTPPSLASHYTLPIVGTNAYAEETDGTTKYRSEVNGRFVNCRLSPMHEEYGDIRVWACDVSGSTGSCSAKCHGGGGGGGGSDGGSCSGGVGSGGVLSSAGSCGVKCHGDGDGGILSLAGSCSAKCHGGGGGGGSCIGGGGYL